MKTFEGKNMDLLELSIPTKIYFGRGILKDSIQKIIRYLTGNVMIVTTGRSLIRLGYLDELLAELKNIKSIDNIIIFDRISANPKLKEINEGISKGISKPVTAIIGFGGGSALDAAKAIAVGIGAGKSIDSFFCGEEMPSAETLPIIAIPTTAGTGSELSKAAIITDTDKKIKCGIRGEALFPKAAIVDSYFTERIPYQITMETGFDVLAHAIESYISRVSNEFTRMLSEHVIKLVSANLPKLSNDLLDEEARRMMSYASMLMGINLANASTCLPHRMQYPLGAHTDTSHGAGLAVLFPAWLKYGYEYTVDKWNNVIYLLSGNNCANVEDAIRILENYIGKLCLPHSLKELGVQNEDIDIFVKEVSGKLDNDPAAGRNDIIYNIYKDSL